MLRLPLNENLDAYNQKVYLQIEQNASLSFSKLSILLNLKG